MMCPVNDQQWVLSRTKIHMKNQGWQDHQGGQEKIEDVQIDRDGPLLSVGVQNPIHALHECQLMLVVQHQLRR